VRISWGFHSSACVLVLFAARALVCFGAPQKPLQVGAARIDITPAANAALPLAGYEGRPTGFQRIHDHIYVRAIVLSDGTNTAAILAWELLGMPTNVWEELAPRISRETGIPVENLLLAGVHAHSAPLTTGMYGRHSTSPSPQTVAYTKRVEDDAVEVVRRAKANLQPAQFGFATGKVYVNINRREFFPKNGWWWLGYNPEGPSDKTDAVLKVTDLSGRPIALLINYPVHAVVMGPENLALSGDLAGATSRYVEQYYQGKILTSKAMGWDLQLRPEEKVDGEGPVALWTSGAAGDQDPVSMDRGEDFSMVEGLGRILGEESVRVANGITVTSRQAAVHGSQRVITCPGRKLEPGERPRLSYVFEDSDPVDIRLIVLKLGQLVLVGVSGEPFTNIYRRLKQRSPFNDLIMVTHANGSSGYIPTDDAFDQVSYEITASDLKPGCAENGILNTLLEMMGSE